MDFVWWVLGLGCFLLGGEGVAVFSCFVLLLNGAGAAVGRSHPLAAAPHLLTLSFQCFPPVGKQG